MRVTDEDKLTAKIIKEINEYNKDKTATSFFRFKVFWDAFWKRKDNNEHKDKTTGK